MGTDPSTWKRDGAFRRETEQCSDPERVMEQFIKGCCLMSDRVREECQKFDLPLLITGSCMNLEEAYEAVCHRFGLGHPPWCTKGSLSQTGHRGGEKPEPMTTRFHDVESIPYQPGPPQDHGPFVAACFDLDGTLIDTEPIHVSAEDECLAAFGIDTRDPRRPRTFGLGIESGMRSLADAFDLDFPAGAGSVR